MFYSKHLFLFSLLLIIVSVVFAAKNAGSQEYQDELLFSADGKFSSSASSDFEADDEAVLKKELAPSLDDLYPKRGNPMPSVSFIYCLKDDCNPGAKFQRCCDQINFNCAGTGASSTTLLQQACKYPPGKLNTSQNLCLARYYDDYNKCYTDGRDNSECCYSSGVPRNCAWGGNRVVDCGDFCRANEIIADPAYKCCDEFKATISECNQKGADMNTDTVAGSGRDQFCKRDCLPSFPDWCKDSNDLKQRVFGVEICAKNSEIRNKPKPKPEQPAKPCFKDKCNPNAKFHRCCQLTNFECTGTSGVQLAQDACQYPPLDLGILQKMCLSKYLTQYVKCYSDGQDNSECCYSAGVPKKCKWGPFEEVDCGDFCRSYDVQPRASYKCCDQYKPQIAECNKNFADMNTDTAAVRLDFCKRDCTLSFPEWCKYGNAFQHLFGAQMCGLDDGGKVLFQFSHTP